MVCVRQGIALLDLGKMAKIRPSVKYIFDRNPQKKGFKGLLSVSGRWVLLMPYRR
jgi:hypothetical protein